MFGWRPPLVGVLLVTTMTHLVVTAANQGGDRSAVSGKVALYASVGEELITFRADVDQATLSRQSSLLLPGFVQEAWTSTSGPFLYVAWSNTGASYAGSGVTPHGDRHGITAFQVDATGALHMHGSPAPLRSRPIHITGDASARHLLVAYNDPSGISVHTINEDGTLGSEVPQSPGLDVGVYAHQVRVLPSNDMVILVTRGNEPTRTTKEDPGALKVFRYSDGKLTNVASIAPANGIGFRSRHVDFDPRRPWIFLTLEAQNRLDVFTRTGGTFSASVTNPTPGGCSWTATSTVSWITITSGGSGSGAGTVSYTVAPYNGGTSTRQGTITISVSQGGVSTHSVKQSP